MPRASAAPLALLRASHPGPTLAVTVLTALLAVAAGHGLGRGALVTAAVLTGQLSIGWLNDLVDAARDREVGRTDKPVARGEVGEQAVRVATGAALAVCAVLSLLCGVVAGVVHLLLLVGSGWAYDLGVKRTAWSAVPYAVAFGSLPAVVTLALPTPVPPAAWTVATGALLGVGAHLLNALPDLADDAATGVHGLPHRLGARRVRVLAPVVLVGATVVSVVGPAGAVGVRGLVTVVAAVLLGLVALRGSGRTPFVAAVLIAVLDVVSLVAR